MKSQKNQKDFFLNFLPPPLPGVRGFSWFCWGRHTDCIMFCGTLLARFWEQVDRSEVRRGAPPPGKWPSKRLLQCVLVFASRSFGMMLGRTSVWGDKGGGCPPKSLEKRRWLARTMIETQSIRHSQVILQAQLAGRQTDRQVDTRKRNQ